METIKNKSDFNVIALIFFVTFFIYYNGLFQAPRADQLIYLAGASNKTSLLSLTYGTFFLNRLPSVGDSLLFRPIFYSLLGVEKWVFGYNFFLWQLTSLFLHLVAVFALFKILRKESSSNAIPFLFAMLFSVSYSSMETVTWTHIPGYIVFTILMLLTIYIIQNYSYFLFKKIEFFTN